MSRVDYRPRRRAESPKPIGPERVDPVLYAWERCNRGRPIPLELLDDGKKATAGMLEQRAAPPKFW